jgi:hypothetical protein
VAIAYHVVIATAGGGHRRTVYRRTAHTDAHGSFTRPALTFAVDPHVLAYEVTVVVTSERGEHDSIGTAGTP